MKNVFFTKGGIFIICFLVGYVVPTQAQESIQDSLYEATSQKSISDHTHSLKLKEVLIPTAVIGVSALCVNNGWLTTQKENIQNVLSAKGKNKIKVDDYIQYSQMVAVYGLNLCGVKGKHSFKDRTIILAMSYATMGILVNTMKFSFKEKRPDSNARNSFPSGHTATAFMGAEFLYREYKDVSPWIGYTGYAVAAATGYLRIYNNRHYFNDVIAGACIGILSTKVAYWLYPKCFKRTKCNNRVTVVGSPYYSTEGLGMNMCVLF